MTSLDIKTPRWALPLIEPYRYKLIKGGRKSGKSHTMAENVVEAMVMDANKKIVCVREIQKSLKFSAKTLIEQKIEALGVGHMFDVQASEIKRKGGSGICIFQGLQDHTADSIKSLEGFDVAWVEEAQSITGKSLKILRPTIMRKDGAEMWFSWNPNQEDDAIEQFMRSLDGDNKAIIIHVNYDENPFLSNLAKDEIEADRRRYPLDFDHIYLGAYDTRADIRVFHNWQVDDIAPTYDDDLYYGCDWGFSQDPCVLLRAWICEDEKRIYVDQQIDRIGLAVDHHEEFFEKIDDSRKYTIRADSARPELIDHMCRRGFNVKAVEKGQGSVEDGVDWLRGFDIVVHPSCELLQKELRLYSYQTNKAGDILPKLEDKNNHCIDALRYAFEPLIKNKTGGGFYVL